MSLARVSRYYPGPTTGSLQTDSPLVVAHQSFVGFALILSDPAAVVTVLAGGLKGGPFEIVITLEGTETFRYPAADQMNILYNAPWLQITWDTGTLQVFQKG